MNFRMMILILLFLLPPAGCSGPAEQAGEKLDQQVSQARGRVKELEERIKENRLKIEETRKALAELHQQLEAAKQELEQTRQERQRILQEMEPSRKEDGPAPPRIEGRGGRKLRAGAAEKSSRQAGFIVPKAQGGTSRISGNEGRPGGVGA
jgi:septal ring factor EnvC (AmiA/AmiB activator)